MIKDNWIPEVEYLPIKQSYRGYLASYFFDQANFDFTAKLAQEIRTIKDVEMYVPQENGEINDKEKVDTIVTDKMIYRADTKELLNSHFLVAIIDGVEIDSGVSCEIGIVSGVNEVLTRVNMCNNPIPIFALYTDMRRNGTGDNRLYRNLFTKGAINTWGAIYDNIDDLVFAIAHWVVTGNVLKQEEIQDR